MKKLILAAAFAQVSVISSPSVLADTVVNDTNSSIMYSSLNVGPGQWVRSNTSGALNGDEHFANYCQTSYGSTPITGPRAAIHFSGTRVSLTGSKGPDRGYASWSIDSGPWQTIDTYSSKLAPQQQLMMVSGLSSGSHILTFQQGCKRRSASTGTKVAIDSYKTTGSAVNASTASTGSLENGEAKFSGKDWRCLAQPSADNLSGKHCWSGTAGDTVSWTFKGSQVEVFGRPDVGNGLFDVLIDNKTVATNVNGYYGNYDNDALTAYSLWSGRVSSSQEHTIKLKVKGQTTCVRPSSCQEDSGIKNLLQFDQFMAVP